ncbi:MAG: cadmium-translocating P-type ATPase [Lachnospiraceae bacterium]|nr:cadmium-translocating P-type ATPase [Lachnospiraceae bacterium]
MSKKFKKRLYRVLSGAVIYVIAVVLSKIAVYLHPAIILAVFLAAYFVIGGDVVRKALRNIGHGRVFDENFLMMLATVGAFFVGDYPEAVAVMLFYQVGELFQSYAVNKSRKSITDLMDIRPDFANVLRNGEYEEVEPDEVEVGETIRIKPGERIPLDGKVIKGNTTLDTMALTGESVPREVLTGESVISGCINLTGVIEVVVEKPFGESTVSKILDLVENASNKKAEAENFISKFARYYTPIVVICAFLLAVIPPIFVGNWTEWVYRALTFLVISCPCALVISIPLSFFGGIGGAGRSGILIKGGNYLEALSETEIVVMDKTGTLTKGVFKVCDIVPDMHNDKDVVSKDELLEIAAYVESFSNHPISKSLQKLYDDTVKKEIDQSRLSDAEETAGYGVSAVLDGERIYAGNYKLMDQLGISCAKVTEIGTVVHIAREHTYLGYIMIADELKEDAQEAIRLMQKAGVKRIVMLTGDRQEAADYTAKQLGISEVHAQLLPDGKLEKVEELFASVSEHGKLVFVGDGMNDAPVLARADIGVAMGGLGSDAAIEAADIVIMTDEPSKIAKAMQISRKTLRIVKQNIVFAIGIKVFVLLLAAIGMASMWAAVFADVGVAVIAILNAMRALNSKD